MAAQAVMSVLRDDDLTAAFDRAAPGYDRLVAANPGYHAQLRRSARRLGLPGRGAGLRLLDLGCGTGASTAALLTVAPEAEIVAVDRSAGMLERAAAKPWPAGVRFVRAPAEGLAAAGVTGPFDAVFAAYLVRNVTDPDRLLATVYGLLAPGGRLAVHDYLLGGGRRHRALWTAVCHAIIQPAGTLTGDVRLGSPPGRLSPCRRSTGLAPSFLGTCARSPSHGAHQRLRRGRRAPSAHRDLYRHLWRSVMEFDTAPAFRDRLRRAGFTRVRVLPVSGWQTGIVHTVVGSVPGGPDRPGDGGAACGR
ncbi:methyltransferase domain-containing protein [Streptomyces sparsogenes]|uniref:class I SAM-dependent methyltransferase n=1 Tax=Streptomyces sparsogenes TaxID=67365 RepID=UPI0033D2C163